MLIDLLMSYVVPFIQKVRMSRLLRWFGGDAFKFWEIAVFLFEMLFK